VGETQSYVLLIDLLLISRFCCF